jgi:hypothetical protein
MPIFMIYIKVSDKNPIFLVTNVTTLVESHTCTS